MNAAKILHDLREERERIDEAIIVIECLSGKRKRGRPRGSKNRPKE